MNIYDCVNNNSPWRNWLARSTVNREVGSSSLPGEVLFHFLLVQGTPTSST